ncbi:MAG: hypothetical protein AB7I25_12745 [Vicinamibacterales bacterium]
MLSPLSRSLVTCAIGCCLTALVSLGAQQSVTPQAGSVPTARLVRAPRLVLPGEIDSNSPMTWDLVDGTWTLSAMASWAGIPSLLSGPALDRMERGDPVTIVPHPGHGIWVEAVVPDEGGVWYGYYHHESAGDACGTPLQAILQIGSARSIDRGRTWQDLGIVLEGPPGSLACGTNNRYVSGGVGDLSAMLDPTHQDLFLFVSQYGRDRSAQGVAVARLAWADRDAPVGRVAMWQNGVWLPAQHVAGEGPERWAYPAGTPLVPVSKPWHDGNAAADAYWGPSVHWNTHLRQYVMLLNRAKNEAFANEGLYVSFSPVLDDPRAWSAPRKILNGGGWYPQVAGLEPGGTDKLAGQRARFFITGRSDYFIEFQR